MGLGKFIKIYYFCHYVAKITMYEGMYDGSRYGTLRRVFPYFGRNRALVTVYRRREGAYLGEIRKKEGERSKLRKPWRESQSYSYR